MNAPFVSIYDRPPSSRTRYVWWRFVEHHLPSIVIYLLVATLIAVVLAPFTLVTVPSGYVGVLWKRFGGGTVLDPNKLKSEGMRITLPWNKVFFYDLRLQSVTETYNAISLDGISLTASINIRYRLKRESVPELHQSIGPEYVEAFLTPEVGNRMREVISEYTAEDVYSTKRAEVQDKIRKLAESSLGEKMMEGGVGEEGEENAPYHIPLYAMVNLIDTLILGIELPDAIVTAINRKIEQYYISEEYKFRVAREIRESERKKIEAEGISEFQRIVSQGISDSYLRWRGIEATLQLAQSSNSKIVIVGSGKDGLPIILGNVDASPWPQPASPAGNGDAAAKERTTAATPSPPLEEKPTTPLEKIPATPLEKTPADTLAKPTEKTPSTQPPEAQRPYSFPTSLSDIKAMLSPLTGTTPPASDAGKPDSNSPKKPAAQ
jgi:regulator of protease activity HflC (stomatin/prohibitin superfamily)